MKKWIVVWLTVVAASVNATNMKWERYMQQTLIHHKEIPGWCSHEKAQKMMELIYQTHPKVCVEIGVFGGSSIYPTVCALRFLKGGIVYAIDPWSNEECLVGYEPNDPHYHWWKRVNLEKVYQNFTTTLIYCDFTKFCTVLRMNSQEALFQFADESIDILHIDGNHSDQVALMDVQLYLPKVKKGGYIWFDDPHWDSSTKPIEFLMANCSQNTELSTATCFLFRKL